MDSFAIASDLDGTVWESWPGYAKVLPKFSETDKNQLQKERFDGGNIVALCKNNEISKSTFVTECRRRIDKFEVYLKVPDTLLELQKRNVPLGIYTSLPR